MILYIVSRLLQSFLVMLGVAVIAFMLFTYVGDPITNLVGITQSDEKREELRETLGLNDPALVQFARFVGRAMTFEFGISYQQKRKVSSIIAERLPATLELSMLSALIALGIGVDDTIHFLTRLRLETRRTDDPEQAIARTFDFAGRAIVMTTTILAAGFLPFLLSDYFLMRMFGTMLPLCMVVALVADLLLVPAMVQLGWLRFPRKEGAV